MSRKHNNFLPILIDKNILKEFWNKSIDLIKDSRRKIYKSESLQINLLWNDFEKKYIENYRFEKIFNKNFIFLSDSFYFYESFISNSSLNSDKLINHLVISPNSWLLMNSFFLYLKSKKINEISSNKIITFYPGRKDITYLKDWKSFVKKLKLNKNKRYFKIDFKSFYKHLNIPKFISFCFENYSLFKDVKERENFEKIFNLVNFYSENEEFPIFEICPLLSYCSTYLYLRKIFIFLINNFKYKNYIEKIVHYVDDTYIFIKEQTEEINIYDFFKEMQIYLFKFNLEINIEKSIFKNILTDDEINEVEKNSSNAITIKKMNAKKILISDVDNYLNLFINEINEIRNSRILKFSDIEKNIKIKINNQFLMEDLIFYTNNENNIKSNFFNIKLDANDLINMINYKPKYFIRLLKQVYKNLEKYNPFKIIAHPDNWNKLSFDAKIYYCLNNSFKIIRNDKKFSSIIKMKESHKIKLDIKKLELNEKNLKNANKFPIILQDLYFQNEFLYKKSFSEKYKMLFMISANAIIEFFEDILNKTNNNIQIKKIFELKKNTEIIKFIREYRNSNTLSHVNINTNIEKKTKINEKNIEKTYKLLKDLFTCYIIKK